MFSVTPSLVQVFEIRPSYLQPAGIKHSCEFKLYDGRTKKINLLAEDINVLLSAIAHENIQFKSTSSPRDFFGSQVSNKSPESLLTEIFKDCITPESETAKLARLEAEYRQLEKEYAILTDQAEGLKVYQQNLALVLSLINEGETVEANKEPAPLASREEGIPELFIGKN